MNSNPLSSSITASFTYSDMLWLVWYIAALIFTIHAIIVIYHWFTYGTTKRVPMIAATIYVTVGLLLLGGAAVLIRFVL